jgi:hypothetical protein
MLSRTFAVTATAAAALSWSAAAQPAGRGCADNVTIPLPFCNPALPIPQRVSDLVGRMNLTEKVGLLASAPGTDECSVIDQGVPRLGIEYMQELVEANSGIASSCYVDASGASYCPTVFPAALTLAASFNRTAWKLKGQIVSDEARAMNNLRVPRIYGPTGLVNLYLYGPDINLVLDPRNGRNGELASEDPFLSGAYAAQYVQGLQNGEDPRYAKVVANLKHV